MQDWVMCVALQLLLSFSFSSIDLLLLVHFPICMTFQKFTDIIHELTENRATVISRENGCMKTSLTEEISLQNIQPKRAYSCLTKELFGGLNET